MNIANELNEILKEYNSGKKETAYIKFKKIFLENKENTKLRFNLAVMQAELSLISEAKNTKPEKLSACVLKRPRHDSIVKSLNSLGVKINFITDGDVSGVISVAVPKSNIDIYIGTGGAPEGVLAAAALKCLGCQMQTRLIYQDTDQKNKATALGIKDLNKKYNIEDMVKGDVIFCATGITDGDLVGGIKDFGDSFESETFVLHKSSKFNKIIKNKLSK